MIGQLISEGLGYGLLLTIMIGPIFVTLTQTGIEKGFRAGATVGLGIWLSDALIITGGIILFKTLGIKDVSADFKFYLGVLGGLILIVFGIGSILKKPSPLPARVKITAKSFLGLLSKGFVVNTFNPFTFIFWLSLITIYIVTKGLSYGMATLFFGTIIFTIMATDLSKVLMAKALRKRMNTDYIGKLNKLAGIGLVLFGLALIIRVL